jgi:hypothetical protein
VRGVVVGGLLGALAGFVGSFAWKTRPLISAMAGGAGKRVGTVRDRRWLSRHPMNYGRVTALFPSCGARRLS